MGCAQILAGLFDVFSSLWLIGDMVLDCLTCAQYYYDNDQNYFIASLGILCHLFENMFKRDFF